MKRMLVLASVLFLTLASLAQADPTVTITAPAANTVATAPATFTVSASATPSAGTTLTQVEFYNGASLLATVTTAPYSTVWSNVPAGSYTVTAKATDDLGASTISAPVTLIANTLPTVTLTSPANNANFIAPASITLTASAADSDGSLNRVEFYQGTILIGTATTAPYATTWANVPVGSYSLSAKAIDNGGGETYAAAVAITVSAPAPRLYYLHTDHLNTPRLVTDASNTIVWRSAPLNEPFGMSVPEEDPDGNGIPFTMNLRFPGQYFDKETNTNYNYFRDYNPEIGRYIQSDPIGLRGGLNTYLYVGGNPLSYVDPTGENAIAALFGGGVLLGGAILMSPAGQKAIKSAAKAIGDLCKSDDDDDQCDIILDKGQLKAAGIRGQEHQVKEDELGTNKNLSKFDLCGCKDGRVVVKAHGCKGPVISVTDYRWK